MHVRNGLYIQILFIKFGIVFVLPPQNALKFKSAPDPPVALLKPGIIMQSRRVVPAPSASYVQQVFVWKENVLTLLPKLTSAWMAE